MSRINKITELLSGSKKYMIQTTHMLVLLIIYHQAQ